MFSLEFTSGRPLGSAPYYSIVIREPYLVGRARGSDILLDHGDIARQHASLTVLRQSQAREQQLEYRRQQQQQPETDAPTAPIDDQAEHTDNINTNVGDENGVDGSFLNDGNTVQASDDVLWGHADAFEVNHPHSQPCALREPDPLMVRVVNLHDGGVISVDDTEVLDEPMYLSDGAQVRFGAHVCMRLRFRPLVVSIARPCFSADYVLELEFMYSRLGATLARDVGPTPRLELSQPIGKLHCTEAMNDDPWCLMALVSGYSVVQPTYVFEWFAALAQSASSPLSVLPPPVRFEVPIQCHGSYAHAAFYLRPESDTCPFPLYPIPTNATLKRARDTLFEGRGFIFLSNAVEQRYRTAVLMCGGAICHPEDILAATPESPSLYAIVDLGMESALEQHEFSAMTALRQIVDDADRSGIRVPIMSERSLFHSLLTNRFSNTEVTLPEESIVVDEAIDKDVDDHSNINHNDNSNTGVANASELEPQQSPQPQQSPNVYPYPYHQPHGADSGQPLRSARGAYSAIRPIPVPRSRLSNRTPSPDRVSLQNCNHTPSTVLSNLIHVSNSKPAPRALPAASILAAAVKRRGRSITPRHASPSANSLVPQLPTEGEAYDGLRHRVRAFAAREEPPLLERLAGARRNLFVDAAALAHAAECVATAERLSEKAAELLAAFGDRAPTAPGLHHCLNDCRRVAEVGRALLAHAPRRTDLWTRAVQRRMSPVASARPKRPPPPPSPAPRTPNARPNGTPPPNGRSSEGTAANTPRPFALAGRWDGRDGTPRTVRARSLTPRHPPKPAEADPNAAARRKAETPTGRGTHTPRTRRAPKRGGQRLETPTAGQRRRSSGGNAPALVATPRGRRKLMH